MYIEEIILEGFKSYATRTVITGWDPEFNAITGLNGTGKSNVLDAICFVLGIDNLKQVRAATLQDLIYKRGAAGITKATVTVIFDNSDPQQQPIGYTSFRKITVARQINLQGRSKYIVNGHTVPQRIVDNLFQSVQLNVNNPHFLIMQGQITRVLNMRPPEILALVEESAGTRMFEDRRAKAISTLEKKESRVSEIERLLQETVDPKLARLRSERSEFLAFQRAEAEIELYERQLATSEYISALKNGKFLETEMIECESLLVSTNEDQDRVNEDKAKIQTELDEAETLRKNHSANKNEIKAAQAAANEVTRISAKADLVRQQISKTESELAKAIKNKNETESKFKVFSEEVSISDRSLENLVSKKEQFDLEVLRSEQLLSSLQTGLNLGATYSGLVSETREKKIASEAKVAESKSLLTSLNKELKSIQDESETTADSSLHIRQKISSLEIEIKNLQQSLDETNDNNDINSLNLERASIATSLANANAACNRYSSGIKGDGIIGSVVELLRVKDADNFEKICCALEAVAGGKLHNVVVKDGETAASLLKTRLPRRITFIPLDRINGYSVDARKVSEAARLTNGLARPATSFIDEISLQKIWPAIQFVFGGTFICETREAANIVAFTVGSRAVTFDGDVYEPCGTLSGGSRSTSESIIFPFQHACEQSEELNRKLANLDARISRFEGSRKTHLATRIAYDRKMQELETLSKHLDLDRGIQLLHRKQTIDAKIFELNEVIGVESTLVKQVEAELLNYANDEEELADNRDGKIKKLEIDLEEKKNQVQKLEADLGKANDRHAKALGRKMALEEKLSSSSEELNNLEADLNNLRVEIKEIEEELLQKITLHTSLQIKSEAELRRLRLQDEKVARLESEKMETEESLFSIQIEISRLTKKVEGTKIQMESQNKSLQLLIDNHSWLSNIDFDDPELHNKYQILSSSESKTLATKIRALNKEKEGRRRNVNPDVIDMIDRVEQKDKSLRQMLATVRKDRLTIADTIQRLEEYTTDALQRTWEKVNGDFGSIMASLLPSSNAALRPVDGQPISEGLEIRVCLVGVWKNSLTELSGGQRSLVALALILSLLQFKPAPLYILDEVDAALDLSHTQSIGRLLRSPRFSRAQFIVVSLKEGMFTNANVLFTTRFREGLSYIQRSVPEKEPGDKEIAISDLTLSTKAKANGVRDSKVQSTTKITA